MKWTLCHIIGTNTPEEDVEYEAETEYMTIPEEEEAANGLTYIPSVEKIDGQHVLVAYVLSPIESFEAETEAELREQSEEIVREYEEGGEKEYVEMMKNIENSTDRYGHHRGGSE